MKASGDFCNPDLNDWGWPVKIKWEDVQTITRDRNK